MSVLYSAKGVGSQTAEMWYPRVVRTHDVGYGLPRQGRRASKTKPNLLLLLLLLHFGSSLR